MCDVDADGVVVRAGRAVHLRHPEGAAPRGPRRLRGAPARTAVPRRRLDGVGRPARPRAPPAARRSRSRSSASTSTCPTPTCRSPRRCGPAGSRTGPGWRSAGCPRTTARTPAGRGGRARPAWTVCCSPAASACAASRASSARSGTPATRGIPTLGLCLGLQCMVIEAARHLAGLDGRQLDRVRPADPAPGDLDDGRPGRRRRRRAGHGRHDAAGCLPGDARRRARSSPRPTASARSPSGTGTATR